MRFFLIGFFLQFDSSQFFVFDAAAIGLVPVLELIDPFCQCSQSFFGGLPVFGKKVDLFFEQQNGRFGFIAAGRGEIFFFFLGLNVSFQPEKLGSRLLLCGFDFFALLFQLGDLSRKRTGLCLQGLDFAGQGFGFLAEGDDTLLFIS